MTQRILGALGVVLAVCIGVRVAAWFIAPLIPALAGLFVVGSVLAWLIVGPSLGRRKEALQVRNPLVLDGARGS